MDNAYAQTVRLLLTIAPDVFAGDSFAMKGGTAINLFVQDMPRLSIDIDVVYIPRQVARVDALKAISLELSAIAERLQRLGLNTRLLGSRDNGDTKLVVDNGVWQVKVEVNVVFRGTVLPIEQRSLSPRTADLFSLELTVPTLASDELYGGKLVAALDRQHPRDLFDVWLVYQTGGLTDGTVECFVTYLAGHNRPTHEVLFGNDKDIASDYESSFAGMANEDVSLEILQLTRARLRQELKLRLSSSQRQFLIGLAWAQPDWTLLQCAHAAELPALRWKLSNLQTFRQRRPEDFEAQAQKLQAGLST